MSSHEDRRAHWHAQVAAQKASGQTAVAWCADHDISPHTFSYWRAKLQSPADSKPGWVSVVEAPEERPASLQVRVGAATIDVIPGFDVGLLRDVVRALAAC